MKLRRFKYALDRAIIRQDKLKEVISKYEVLIQVRRNELTLLEQNIKEYRKITGKENYGNKI